MKLIVKEGYYEAPNLFALLLEVFKHRMWHYVNHGKWMD